MDSNQRGGRRAIMGGRRGRVSQGTYIKDPWTMAVGGVELILKGGWSLGQRRVMEVGDN